MKKLCATGCGKHATIRTIYDRWNVIFHCGNICWLWWMRHSGEKVATIDSTERSQEGFPA